MAQHSTSQHTTTIAGPSFGLVGGEGTDQIVPFMHAAVSAWFLGSKGLTSGSRLKSDRCDRERTHTEQQTHAGTVCNDKALLVWTVLSGLEGTEYAPRRTECAYRDTANKPLLVLCNDHVCAGALSEET